MRIDVWSDVVCPYCWVGKHRLEEALARQGVTDAQIVFHAFELNPAAAQSRPLVAYLAERFGSEARVRAAWQRIEQMGAPSGLAFAWDAAIAAPTLDAHRLILHAQAQGLGAPMKERLMRAHFQDGADVADRATLLALAHEVGVKDAAPLLEGSLLEKEVRADEAAARGMGIGGVPFFVFDQKLAVSGAQPVELFEEAIREARSA